MKIDLETLDYAIHPLYVHRMLQLLPAFYKINRVNGLNSYQSSVLFAIYNTDTHGAGMKLSEVEQVNPMAKDNVRRNLNELTEKGILMISGETTPRNKRYHVTVDGMRVAQSIALGALTYKGEKINTMPKEGTYIQQMAAGKEKAIQRMMAKPTFVKEAAKRIQEQELKGKEVDSV